MNKIFSYIKANRAGHCLALFAFFILFILSSNSVQAQSDSLIVVSGEIPVATVSDSALLRKHSPTKALWMSTVLPGLGQAYNKQYWKIPIVYAGLGATIYFAIDNYKSAQKFKNEYLHRVHGDTASFDPYYRNYPESSIYNLYTSYNKDFQLMIVLGSVVYLLNILDAYVSAHLFTFDISDDLSLNISPKIDYNYLVYRDKASSFDWGVKLRLNF